MLDRLQRGEVGWIIDRQPEQEEAPAGRCNDDDSLRCVTERRVRHTWPHGDDLDRIAGDLPNRNERSGQDYRGAA